MNISYPTKALSEILGITRQGVEKRAKRNGWKYYEIRGHGRNGMVKNWLVSSMDNETKVAIGIKNKANNNVLSELKFAKTVHGVLCQLSDVNKRHVEYILDTVKTIILG